MDNLYDSWVKSLSSSGIFLGETTIGSLRLLIPSSERMKAQSPFVYISTFFRRGPYSKEGPCICPTPVLLTFRKVLVLKWYLLEYSMIMINIKRIFFLLIKVFLLIPKLLFKWFCCGFASCFQDVHRNKE